MNNIIVFSKRFPLSPIVWGAGVSSTEYREEIRNHLLVERKGTVPSNKALLVEVEFGLTEARIQLGNDLDNLIKNFFDTLTKEKIWKDDRFVSEIHASRIIVESESDEYVAVVIRVK